MSSSKRRRFIDVIRRTANLGGQSGRGPLEDAALWESRDRAAKSAAEAEKLAEKVAASVTRQRSQIETAVLRGASLGARSDAVNQSAEAAERAFELLSVVSLNAALEGARLGDVHGKSLLLLAEETKTHVQAGLESSRALKTLAQSLGSDASELGQRLERVNRDSLEIGADSALLKSAAQDTSIGLGELESRLRKATGFDPEVARNLAEAGDHAKGLISALTALEAREIGGDHGSLSEALTPAIAPLRKLLAALTESDSQSTREGEG